MQADPVIELGEHILVGLKAEQTNDTLTRWLAHHIARLMTAADDARATGAPDADARASEAHAAILELWRHRSVWPEGWPPRGAAAMAALLDSIPELDSPGWHEDNSLSRLQNLHHQILATLTDLAAVGKDDVEQGWLDTFGDRLTADETTLLTRSATAAQRINALPQWLKVARAASSEANLAVDDSEDGAAVASPLRIIVALVELYNGAIRDLVSRVIEKHGDE